MCPPYRLLFNEYDMLYFLAEMMTAAGLPFEYMKSALNIFSDFSINFLGGRQFFLLAS